MLRRKGPKNRAIPSEMRLKIYGQIHSTWRHILYLHKKSKLKGRIEGAFQVKQKNLGISAPLSAISLPESHRAH